MNHNKIELGELLEQLDLDENQIRQTLADIQRGDELLEQCDRIVVDPALINRVAARLRRAPTSQSHIAGNRWLSVAALAASLLIVLGVTILIKPASPPAISLGDESDSYRQQAWMREFEIKRDVDDMILSEVLHCWSEAEWEVDDILGPKNDGPQNPLNVGRSPWSGPRFVE